MLGVNDDCIKRDIFSGSFADEIFGKVELGFKVLSVCGDDRQ